MCRSKLRSARSTLPVPWDMKKGTTRVPGVFPVSRNYFVVLDFTLA